MLYDFGKLNVIKALLGEILSGLSLVALGAGVLFLAITMLLLVGKLIRFAWGW